MQPSEPRRRAPGLINLPHLGSADPPRAALDRAGLLERIERLGFVQIDSINTVERAHHQILFARAQGYRQRDLDRLHARDAALFEHWTHDAALIPTAFYRYWRPRFERDRTRLVERWRKWQGPEFEAALNRVRTAVRDRGPGISEEYQERIFSLFQRAVSRRVEGTGAGLAIVRQVAERHGGSAFVRSRDGGGSEFVITLAQQ